jgi:peptidoglycan L-alanyl-D-glutamate endopeptidase CwlK
MNSTQMIREVQGKLGVTADGLAGPQTWSAIYQAVVGKAVPATPKFAGAVDARSEKVIATLQAEVAPYARMLVQRALAAGVVTRIIAGLRTYAEQDALFAQGRTRPGRKVTNAKGGESNHNFGIAFDVGVFEGAVYLGESPRYDVVGALGQEIGLEWGGHWSSMADKPHFQLRPGWAAKMSEAEMLSQLRDRVKAGKAIYA